MLRLKEVAAATLVSLPRHFLVVSGKTARAPTGSDADSATNGLYLEYYTCSPARPRLGQMSRAGHWCRSRDSISIRATSDPDFDAKLDRIEHVTSHFLDRCFAFDQFGPLSIRPCHGTCWAPRTRPARLPAT